MTDRLQNGHEGIGLIPSKLQDEILVRFHGGLQPIKRSVLRMVKRTFIVSEEEMRRVQTCKAYAS